MASHEHLGHVNSRALRKASKLRAGGRRPIDGRALDYLLGVTDTRAFIRTVLPTNPETALARAFARAVAHAARLQTEAAR